MSFTLRHYLDCWDDDRCPGRDCELCDDYIMRPSRKNEETEYVPVKSTEIDGVKPSANTALAFGILGTAFTMNVVPNRMSLKELINANEELKR